MTQRITFLAGVVSLLVMGCPRDAPSGSNAPPHDASFEATADVHDTADAAPEVENADVTADSSVSDVSPDIHGNVDASPEASVDASGSPETLDLLSWNIQHFPKHANTIARVASILGRLEPDLVAVQEIVDRDGLDALAAALPGWKAEVVYVDSDQLPYNPPVGFLYNAEVIKVLDRDILFENNTRAFPRSPYEIVFTWNNRTIRVINVHLKAMGDNVIADDPWDEERRRQEACTILSDYVQTQHPDDAVVLLGDFNDRLEEPAETNVFGPLLTATDAFLFADWNTVQNPTQDNFTYPTGHSHLDHILISNELFDAMRNPGSVEATIQAEQMVGGWYTYSQEVTDHRPIMLKLRW